MRVFAFMLGFNRAEMVRGGLENFEATTTDQEHRRLVKTLIICQYPLPSVDENRAELLKLAAEFGWWCTEIPNAGVMENHNVCIHDLAHLQAGDYYVCADPDVRWQQKGWLSASIEALSWNDETVFCAAALPHHDEEWCWKAHGRVITKLPSGLRIARYRQLLAWSTGVWKGEWLAARPRNFKAKHPQYGWTEHADIELMHQHGKKWLTLVDYYDHHLGSEPQYVEWKIECAQGKTSLPFNVWLQKKGG